MIWIVKLNLSLSLFSSSFDFYSNIPQNVYWQLFASLLIFERLRFNSEFVRCTTPIAKSKWLDGKFCLTKFLNVRIIILNAIKNFINKAERICISLNIFFVLENKKYITDNKSYQKHQITCFVCIVDVYNYLQKCKFGALWKNVINAV